MTNLVTSIAWNFYIVQRYSVFYVTYVWRWFIWSIFWSIIFDYAIKLLVYSLCLICKIFALMCIMSIMATNIAISSIFMCQTNYQRFPLRFVTWLNRLMCSISLVVVLGIERLIFWCNDNPSLQQVVLEFGHRFESPWIMLRRGLLD